MTTVRKLPVPLLLLLLLFTAACSKKEIAFGNEMGETYTNLLQVDTVSVNLSTVALDSFATSSISGFLAGSYADSLLGTVKTKAFLQLATASNLSLEDDAVFDSLCFVIKLNDYFYGDTTQPQTVTVTELAAPIEYRYGSYIYNTSSFAEKAAPLGAKTTRINPRKDDSVVVRLDAAKGLELFTKLREGAAELQTTDDFLNYFKGVSIGINSAGPSAVFGFAKSADSVYMRLHYHTTVPYPEARYRDFGFYNNLYSNQIVSDRSGTALASLAGGEVSAALTGNRAFTQAGTGLLLKMTFPGLRSVLQIDSTVRLLRATLTLKVPANSYSGLQPLPASLLLVTTDASNAFGSALYNSTGEYIVTASPTYDALYDAPTNYTFELTSFVNSLLNTSGSENSGLFLLENYPGASGTLNKAALYNSSALNGSQLVLSLLTIKTN